MRILIFLILIMVTGCADKTTVVVSSQIGPIEAPETVTQNCTVTQLGNSALITCPDGTFFLVAPKIEYRECNRKHNNRHNNHRRGRH